MKHVSVFLLKAPPRKSSLSLAYLILGFFYILNSLQAQSLSGFTLLNAVTNTEIGPLRNGDVINLATTGPLLNVRANPGSGNVKRVVFALDGVENYRTETRPPYTLAGDTDQGHYDWTPSIGSHTLRATPYGASGKAGTPLTITFTVINQAPTTNLLTGFTLINASTGADLGALPDGSQIDLQLTGPLLNVRANPGASALSKVVFALDGVENYRTETLAPYTLAGDTDQGHYDWTPSIGSHTLKATPYTTTGQAGTPLLISFSVVSSTPPASDLTGFTLINASTNVDLGPLTDGAQIDLRTTGSLLNVRANPGATALSKVVFALDGVENYRTETVAPYTLAGDSNQGSYAWTPSLGSHTLKATPYTTAGQAGTPLVIAFTVIASPAPQEPGDGQTPAQVTLQGELRQWHKITLAIEGPETSETAADNPFLTYRLNVTFTNGTKRYVVPGYYAADGNAAQTGAASGRIWKVHFSPDETGVWSYSISLRKGASIAVSEEATAGEAVTGVDGKTGQFTVEASDKTSPDLRAKGRLKYVGEHYLQFAQTGEYFLKGGVDSPENLLSYADFDNTPDLSGRRKTWSPHVADWQPGDPTWQGAKGKGLIGAINYLASQQMNVFSFITMGVNGDDRNVYPYASPSDYTRFDCSKLDQWETVFEHGEKRGMYLHFKTQERENCTLLDGGAVGLQRKLYYRELIARFGHHLALNWNLGEENIQTTQQRIEMARYFAEHDPYQHHIVMHTNVKEQNAVYTPLLGQASQMTGASIQTDWNNVYAETRLWVQNSANAGKKWVVANDEQNSMGVACDADYAGNRGTLADNQDQIRKESLWGNLMAGGGGIEYYFGGATGQTDLAAEDFRSRAKMYRFTRHALDFFRRYVSPPLPQFKPLSNVSRGWALGQEGQVYVVYLKEGGSATITLPSGAYTVQWYDPRNGGALQSGSVQRLTGGGSQSIGTAPNSGLEDWAVLIRLADPSPSPSVTTRPPVDANGRLAVSAEPLRLAIETFPNPFTESFTIRMKGEQKGKIPVTVYDTFGRKVLELPDARPDQEIRLGREFSPGLYVLKVGEGRRAHSHTLVKAP
ncbi:DUF5060 domain-containing protein [Larkinella insperata]|uniref:DUF5060 domain-containing protein n=1 Tax=Larkinella insperata TaxID=332158 RepID=A0ABW3Q2R9_9BACT